MANGPAETTPSRTRGFLLLSVVFLLGVVLGAIVYNEAFGLTAGLLGKGTVLMAFGLPRGLFALSGRSAES